MARDDHGHAVKALRFAQRMRKDGFQHFVQKGRSVKGVRIGA
jgi:hypothetical protein